MTRARSNRTREDGGREKREERRERTREETTRKEGKKIGLATGGRSDLGIRMVPESRHVM